MRWNYFLDGLLAHKSDGTFEESEHPRQPAGSDKGGEFAPKNTLLPPPKRAGPPPANDKYIDPYKRLDTPTGRVYMSFDVVMDTNYPPIDPRHQPVDFLRAYAREHEEKYNKKPDLIFAGPKAFIARLAPDGYAEVEGVRIFTNPRLDDFAVVVGTEWKPTAKPRVAPKIDDAPTPPQSAAPASDAYLSEDLRIPPTTSLPQEKALFDWNATFLGPYLNKQNEIRIPSGIWNEQAKAEWKKRNLRYDGNAREWYFKSSPDNAREQLRKARVVYDKVWGITDRSAGFGAWLQTRSPELHARWQQELAEWTDESKQVRGYGSLLRWQPDTE